jgi:hypothetical protein
MTGMGKKDIPVEHQLPDILLMMPQLSIFPIQNSINP